jgi:nitrite reductase/ring-hydroxylating ferredoxin subunit
VGVDQTTFEEPPEDWTTALRDDDLPEGESRFAEVGGVGVLVARHQGAVYALSNRCAHRGGPLDEGELHDGCVTCPWHRSVFKLEDGSVVRGPSAYPQPRWETRVRDGVIEIKPA